MSLPVRRTSDWGGKDARKVHGHNDPFSWCSRQSPRLGYLFAASLDEVKRQTVCVSTHVKRSIVLWSTSLVIESVSSSVQHSRTSATVKR